MKRSGASLLVYALEQIGVSKTFGIPGMHNTEIYNQLSQSRLIEPVIVTHELSAGYMSDAVSKTTDTIGTMVIVPGAGLTHAMSALGEAFVDGIPLLVISGGVNRQSGKSFQLHQMDMQKVTSGIVKAYYLIDELFEIIPAVYDAYKTAISGEPGPVFIEMPLRTQLMQESVNLIPFVLPEKANPFVIDKNKGKPFRSDSSYGKLTLAADLLSGANNPGIYVGWGAAIAYEEINELANLIAAPVATTVQGVSIFPADNPLHTGIGFGPYSTPAAQNAFKNCDCLIAIGLKFSELATGNYQLDVPKSLIHVDINPNVFNKNYPAKVAIEGDSKVVLSELTKLLKEMNTQPANDASLLALSIKRDKDNYKNSWFTKAGERMVTPGFFFNALRNSTPRDVIIVADDGNHMLLTAELFPIYTGGNFISPTDYNGMGYGIPAAIGAKLVSRHKMVVAVIGDGALLMCGNELITAKVHKIGILVFVFRDEKSRTVVEEQYPLKSDEPIPLYGALNLEGFAKSVHAEYLSMKSDIDISGVLTKAIEKVNKGNTVIVEVNIDYSRKSIFGSSLVKPKSSRISFTDKLKMLFTN